MVHTDVSDRAVLFCSPSQRQPFRGQKRKASAKDLAVREDFRKHVQLSDCRNVSRHYVCISLTTIQ